LPMTSTGNLFDRTLPTASRRTDPATSHAAERAMNASGRRGSQKERILAALREGPKTNAQLAAMSLKYTGRISDLRHDGHRIVAARIDGSGKTLYRLDGAENPDE